MTKVETALVIAGVGALGWFLYQRSQKQNAVAPTDQTYAENSPNGQVKNGLDDYYGAGKTVYEGGKKVIDKVSDWLDW